MTEKQKQCCVRIPQELHHWAKVHAYHSCISLQDYICSLIEERKIIWEGMQPKEENLPCENKIHVVLYDGAFCGCFSSYDLAKDYLSKNVGEMSMYEIFSAPVDILHKLQKISPLS